MYTDAHPTTSAAKRPIDWTLRNPHGPYSVEISVYLPDGPAHCSTTAPAGPRQHQRASRRRRGRPSRRSSACRLAGRDLTGPGSNVGPDVGGQSLGVQQLLHPRHRTLDLTAPHPGPLGVHRQRRAPVGVLALLGVMGIGDSTTSADRRRWTASRGMKRCCARGSPARTRGHPHLIPPQRRHRRRPAPRRRRAEPWDRHRLPLARRRRF